MATTTLTITEFLLARIAEDEEVAQAARGADADPASWAPIWTSLRSGTTGVCDHGPRGSVEMQPARVLAECEAKRRIVEEHGDVDPCDAHDASFETIDCGTLRFLALPYADHEDYREEWKP